MKPILSTFVFSEDSKDVPNNNNGVSLHLINPQNVFTPPFMPCTYSFSATFGVINLDYNENNILEFRIISPDNKVVLTTGKVNLKQDGKAKKSLPKIANGFTFNMDFRNVALEEKGRYTAKVIINDDVIGEVPLIVYPKGD